MVCVCSFTGEYNIIIERAYHDRIHPVRHEMEEYNVVTSIWIKLGSHVRQEYSCWDKLDES